ncbi:MAG: hypothetical protein P8Z76_16875 [Alphaproteobacteria bacterium]
MRSDPVPRRDHDRQRTRPEEFLQALPAHAELGDDDLRPTLAAELDLLVALARMVGMTIAMLKHADSGAAVIDAGRKRGFGVLGDHREGQRGGGFHGRGQQTVERGARRHRVVVAPPEARDKIGVAPGIELARKIVPISHDCHHVT